MINVKTNCPHCHTEITMEVVNEDMMTLISTVHCTPCAEIKQGQFDTENRIKHICDLIRSSSGDAEKLNKLEGALKAQYSSAKLLRKKLESRLPATRQKQIVDSDSNQRLPW